MLLAGGGTPPGKVVGSTDCLGGDVRDTPTSPKDILATAFHLLGIDSAHDCAGSTKPACADCGGRPGADGVAGLTCDEGAKGEAHHLQIIACQRIGRGGIGPDGRAAGTIPGAKANYPIAIGSGGVTMR